MEGHYGRKQRPDLHFRKSSLGARLESLLEGSDPGGKEGKVQIRHVKALEMECYV